jgi:hypothetical protein
MNNDFKPNDGGKVSRSNAEKWIKKYDDDHRKEKEKDTKSVFFGKDFLTTIMNTPGATGISFFFAKKYSDHAKKDVLDLVLVPTKEDGTLLWPSSIEGKDGTDDMAYDSGKPCPPYCP